MALRPWAGERGTEPVTHGQQSNATVVGWGDAYSEWNLQVTHFLLLGALKGKRTYLNRKFTAHHVALIMRLQWFAGTLCKSLLCVTDLRSEGPCLALTAERWCKFTCMVCTIIIFVPFVELNKNARLYQFSIHQDSCWKAWTTDPELAILIMFFSQLSETKQAMFTIHETFSWLSQKCTRNHSPSHSTNISVKE